MYTHNNISKAIMNNKMKVKFMNNHLVSKINFMNYNLKIATYF